MNLKILEDQMSSLKLDKYQRQVFKAGYFFAIKERLKLDKIRANNQPNGKT